MDPMPKRCHHCKSESHLIENCPTLPDEKKRPQKNDQDVNNGVNITIPTSNKDHLVTVGKSSNAKTKNAKTSKPKK